MIVTVKENDYEDVKLVIMDDNRLATITSYLSLEMLVKDRRKIIVIDNNKQ